MARVTIYNDDEHGRAIRVTRMNPYTDAPLESVVMPASTDSHSESKGFEVRNGELLVIVTAEKDS